MVNPCPRLLQNVFSAIVSCKFFVFLWFFQLRDPLDIRGIEHIIMPEQGPLAFRFIFSLVVCFFVLFIPKFPELNNGTPTSLFNLPTVLLSLFKCHPARIRFTKCGQIQKINPLISRAGHRVIRSYALFRCPWFNPGCGTVFEAVNYGLGYYF